MQKHIYIDTYDAKNNCIYEKNAVVSEYMYSKKDWQTLLAGDRIESEWDDEGNPIRWDFMHQEEEDCQ